ncbi:MAG: cardiolipin synthase [Desulfobacteraceae bacterium]|nr:cardiolipin synthase [Desulfobacteraceae bacterium]MBC2752403.1 PLDc N-terminal domain-containing protein [Desulfobacteraceae bacterium]
MDTIITLLAITVLLVEILGILAAVHAVMNARTSQGAAAWAIALVTLPFITLGLYAVFGRNKFQGYVRMRNRRDAVIHHLSDTLQLEADNQNLTRKSISEANAALVKLAGMPILGFNQSRLLINGQETFDRLFEDIAAARSYILVEFYIVNDDHLGRRLKDRLIRKAQDGISVFFLYDEIGSYQLPGNYLREMQQAGIHVSAFHSTRGKTNHFQLNFHPRFGHWRDTHVKIEGPVVKAVQFCFAEDWHWATSRVPDLNWTLTPSPGGTEDALVVASGPADTLETCGLMFVQVINMARERIWIASPYFVPDLQVLSALKLAVLRGVDVRIMLPEKADHRTVHLASFSYYPNILPVGIDLYRYTAGFLHQKVFLVDHHCAAVGTANLDNRSFRLNFELTLLNYDAAFVGAVAEMLEEDFHHSRLVKLEDYTERSFLFKLAVRSARLLAPIL